MRSVEVETLQAGQAVPYADHVYVYRLTFKGWKPNRTIILELLEIFHGDKIYDKQYVLPDFSQFQLDSLEANDDRTVYTARVSAPYTG